MTIDVIHAADRLLELEWSQAMSAGHKKKVAEMGAWTIGGFCTGLCGEEMLLIEFAGTLRSLDHMVQQLGDLPPHFDVSLQDEQKETKCQAPSIS